MGKTPYDEDYFLRGRETGKSLYENYRWLPELTIPMARRIAQVCGMEADDSVCDFGCARGYTVRAFRELGFRAYGFDVSAWAVNNCDPSIPNYVRLIEGDSFARVEKTFDWVIAKDVLEHISDKYELARVVGQLQKKARKGIFVVVPLSERAGEPYVVPEYEADVTHVHRLALGDWVGLLTNGDFCASGCHRIVGIKDNYAQYERGNGFLIARRLPIEGGEE